MAKTIPKTLFDKVEKLAQKVKHDLRDKGLIVPVKNSDGSINVDLFRITKQDNFYYVVNHKNQIVVGPINLAQTAIILANDLALGRLVDPVVINNDKWFGYKSFDEELHQRSARISLKKHNTEQAEMHFTRAEIAKQKKIYWKKTIADRFNQLRRVQ